LSAHHMFWVPCTILDVAPEIEPGPWTGFSMPG
jgi:hypothetical protein